MRFMTTTMRIVQPHELKTLLAGHSNHAVAFLSDRDWELYGVSTEAFEPLKVECVLLEPGEIAPNPGEGSEWRARAHTGWLLYGDSEDLGLIASLFHKPKSPIGSVVSVSTQASGALLIAPRPVFLWTFSRRGVWHRGWTHRHFADLSSIRFGEPAPSRTFLFSSGEAIVLSPRNGIRPYVIHFYLVNGGLNGR